jgi:hypothetical protein
MWGRGLELGGGCGTGGLQMMMMMEQILMLVLGVIQFFIEAGDTPFSNVTMPEVQLSSVQFSCCQGILFIRQMR